ncbi:pseudouridylate synthase 7 homolog [Caerostris darwini]|uniref:Pseudouridylate synthase 7 homolog n=1 Tax=Caerostris darwini TaxID=1538125 RepID=A0AAV4S278_9ARAC|nr:pseudouridylate synthase 7 homolog [Caerostris darwini]
MDSNNTSKRALNSQHTDENCSPPSKKLCSELDESHIESSLKNKSQNENSCNAIDRSNLAFGRVSEGDVGITEYISNLPGFTAVMKERYSDFVVNEIDTEGNVVRLTNFSQPQNPENDVKVDDLLDAATVKSLEELVADEKSDVKIDVTDMDKDARKKIHVAIRKMFDGVESSTEDKDEKKFIIVKKFQTKKRRRFQLSVKGNYLHFVLYKENRDTMDTINCISSYFRVQPKVFSYAGSKDKRGKTSQLVSAYKIKPERLLSINKEFNNIKVGNIIYKNEQLNLGDLWGNRFAIVLRQLDGDPETIGKAIDSLSAKGFINYYGMQRFGTQCIPTHSIGRMLLHSNWEGAIDLILTPRQEDPEDLLAAKQIWIQSKDAKLALQNLKRKFGIEGKLLSGLASTHEKDLYNALGAIPRNMRLMYLHSYQSYIWNKVASKRIKEYGLKVLKGDLVSSEAGVIVDNSEVEKEEGNRKAVLSSIVKVISEDEIDKYDISDVLLPLPGHSVVFPDNETKDWYDEFLKEDGMNWTNFDSKIKANSLSGAYRKLIVVPKDVKWEILPYTDVTKSLLLSDFEILQGTTELIIDKSGPLKALKLEFQLPPSAYATMVIREISKQSTCYSPKT